MSSFAPLGFLDPLAIAIDDVVNTPILGFKSMIKSALSPSSTIVLILERLTIPTGGILPDLKLLLL